MFTPYLNAPKTKEIEASSAFLKKKSLGYNIQVAKQQTEANEKQGYFSPEKTVKATLSPKTDKSKFK